MKQYKLFSVLFLLLMILPAGFLLLRQDRAFSENENRYLTLAPEPDLGALLSGQTQEKLEQWMADQFPGRDGLMGLSTGMKKALGYRDIGGAYLGADGYYLEMHTPEDFDQKKYLRNLGYLERLAQQSGVPAAALLIPCAASAQPGLLPACAESYDPAQALELARTAMPSVTLPDLTSALREREEQQLYYRTDHHWTAEGARIGYECLTGGKGAYVGQSEVFSRDFYGTTWSKVLDPAARPDAVLLYPVSESLRITADGNEIPLYDRSAAERKDQYTVYLGGNHGLVTITGGCQNGKTLLVLKDSFANCLAPLLTADYETVVLVDLRYYPGSVRALLRQLSPDALLFVYEMSGIASGDDFVKLLL